jgi:hypothetical protein
MLEGYAVQLRYPGQTADKNEATCAYKNASVAREYIRTRLKDVYDHP